LAVRFRVEVPAAAVALPVSVSVQATVPAAVRDGELQLAVKPLGNPEARVMVDPAAAVLATTPPTGVAVTVAVVLASERAAIVVGETLNCTLGAAFTCKVICLLAETLSPVAVTVTVAEPVTADEDAAKVRVEVPDSFERVRGLVLQIAVAPVGRPVTLNVTAPA
jgi:hypothetical protein